MVDVYRRPRSQFWYFDIMVAGVRTRRSTKRTIKKEAEAVAAKELSKQLDAEQLGRVPEITLRGALFDLYLPERINKASYKNLRYYCGLLCGDNPDVVKLGKGGDMPFHELTEQMLRDYRNRRLAQGKAEATIDHELKPVSAAYRIAAKTYRVRPALTVPMKRPKGKARPLSEDEITALLADLDPNRPMKARGGGTYLIRPLARTQLQRVDNYDLVVMFLDTGARWSEIATLTWDKVDTLKFEWIDIFRSKVDGQGGRSHGRLATTSRMRDVLRRRYGDRGNSLYVFKSWSTEAGDEDAPREYNSAIRRAMNRIGINHPAKVREYGRRSVRSLRDTFATRLRRRGMGLDDLQTLLGHASPQMTAKYAAYDSLQASSKAVALMEEMPGAESAQ